MTVHMDRGGYGASAYKHTKALPKVSTHGAYR